ncbi:molybdenum cofactor guanylyltransferase MobA [Paracoccus aminophilus]|uniref:Molybdenum cofactor guanylyltransferase n=1 Tax=Paracoccus aminophilus JCM 7686 TaxID=1367847 RepID=S5XV50_PARAH|nr:molybdenum cofactor guanylyltransferase MobA [Paracoccus aminophilus]AGT07215.1 molybdopterin-guanine dinucleotide biosynthesis protein A [Paracoccus aminophilus JCM 7686]
MVNILGPKSKKLPAIILAGGRATRMGGGNKALRVLGGETLLARVIARLSDQCAPVAINANTDPEAFAGYKLPIIADTIPGFPGPLAGILAGMEWAAGLGAEAVVSVSVDTPFLPLDLVHRLREAAGRHGIALAASTDAETGRMQDHPTCSLWPVSLREDLAQAIESGLLRPGQFAAAYDPGRAVFASQPFDPFTNVNTPGDLAEAEALTRTPAGSLRGF